MISLLKYVCFKIVLYSVLRKICLRLKEAIAVLSTASQDAAI